MTRVDDDRRRSDARIPANAKWHTSFIDDFSAGADRKRYRTFSETWPLPVGADLIDATNFDVRTAAPQYQLVRQRLALVVTDPFINPDTGYPVIGLAIDTGAEEFCRLCFRPITFGGLFRAACPAQSPVPTA